MSGCKHAAFYGLTWDGDGVTWMTGGDDARRCWFCGSWLSLGPENDEDERVQVEIDAASLACSYADDNRKPGYDRFDACPYGGDELCEVCEVMYLASEIAHHEARVAEHMEYR